LSLGGEHIKDKLYINFNNINLNFEIFFTHNRVFKHKVVVYNLHVCCNGLGKIVSFIHISLFYKISKLYKFEKI